MESNITQKNCLEILPNKNIIENKRNYIILIAFGSIIYIFITCYELVT